MTLRQANQAQRQTPFEAGSKSHPVDFAAIADDLDFIKAQLARIPTRKDIARLVSLATLATAALVLIGEMLLG